MDRVKLWLLRRWLKLLPDADLVHELDWRRNTRLMDAAYETLAQDMLEGYWAEYKDTNKPNTKEV